LRAAFFDAQVREKRGDRLLFFQEYQSAPALRAQPFAIVTPRPPKAAT
jgi:hypothetical protein